MDSNYQFINVAERISDMDSSRWVRMLQLDYLIHGYVDVSDPGHLEYHYERVYREVIRRFIRDKKMVSAFFIGGGSYTFPRWVLHEWPGARIDVAEIDPMVVEVNYEALGLPVRLPYVLFVQMPGRSWTSFLLTPSTIWL